MPTASEIARRHAEAARAGPPRDLIGQALLDLAAELLAQEHGPERAAEAILFVARNLGDEEDYSFMRP